MSWTAYPFSDRIRRLLRGSPFGAVFPPAANALPLPNEDARTHALRALRDYLTEVTFQLRMGQGVPNRAFRIRPERFLLEWPDSPARLLYPSIVCVPGEMQMMPPVELGGPSILEDTADVFGPGTVLIQFHEHVERVTLQVHASTKSMRRAISAGLESVMSPTEERTGFVFRLPSYYDQTCRFTLAKRERQEDADTGDSARRRRTENVALDLEVNVVQLVRIPRLKVILQTGVV